jgi:hypothetical protein
MPWKQKCPKYNTQSALYAKEYIGLVVNVKDEVYSW